VVINNVRVRRGVFTVSLVLILSAQVPLAQTRAGSQQSGGFTESELRTIESDCQSGTSAYSKQQCAFFVKMIDAMRRVNAIIASGEYKKLPESTHQTMLALVDTVQAALPLMKDRR